MLLTPHLAGGKLPPLRFYKVFVIVFRDDVSIVPYIFDFIIKLMRFSVNKKSLRFCRDFCLREVFAVFSPQNQRNLYFFP